MNLRVNLILESEQRSASPLSQKGILRITAFAVPATILVLLLVWGLNLFQLKGEVAMLEQEWTAIAPQQVRARQQREELDLNEERLRQLQALSQSRIEWSTQLTGLMRETPANIQLQSLRASQTAGQTANGKAARLIAMVLEGKATGVDADSSVANFRRRLVESDSFAAQIERVDVRAFGVDTTLGADKNDRTFRIDCAYKERVLR